MHGRDNIITAMEADLGKKNMERVFMFSRVWHDVFGYSPLIEATETDKEGIIKKYKVEGYWWRIDAAHLNLHFDAAYNHPFTPSTVRTPADLLPMLEAYHETSLYS